jgi:hypothetical protein
MPTWKQVDRLSAFATSVPTILRAGLKGAKTPAAGAPISLRPYTDLRPVYGLRGSSELSEYRAASLSLSFTSSDYQPGPGGALTLRLYLETELASAPADGIRADG